jgi:predicted kinase
MKEGTSTDMDATASSLQLVRRLRSLFVTLHHFVKPVCETETEETLATSASTGGRTAVTKLKDPVKWVVGVGAGDDHYAQSLAPRVSPTSSVELEGVYDQGHDECNNSWTDVQEQSDTDATFVPSRTKTERADATSFLHESCRARVILLCGLPGSGKSTFAKKVLERGGSTWQRISQDDLGSRQECERLMQEALTACPPRHVIIDRCNVDRNQRTPWIEVAAQANAYPVGVVVFPVTVDECIRRVQLRGADHPTLYESSDSNIVKVILSFASKWQNPSPEEGISFCRVIQSAEDIERVLAELV